MTMTLTDIETLAGRECYRHVRDLLADVEVPVLAGPQSQGDLLAVPCGRTPGADTVDVPVSGIDIIEARDGGHAHTLVAPDGGARIHLRRPTSADDLVLAVVEAAHPVFLLHSEHGATGLAAGCWEIRGQREFDAAEARRVAD
jgi:hypothetical protein